MYLLVVEETAHSNKQVTAIYVYIYIYIYIELMLLVVLLGSKPVPPEQPGAAKVPPPLKI